MTTRFQPIRSLASKARDAWAIIGISLALLVLCEGTCRMLFWARGRPEDKRAGADAYRDAPWAGDYYRELAGIEMRWHAYVYWRYQPHQGRWIHVDERGIRRTWKAPRKTSSRPPRVFTFGGSTMWGSGARDDHTIASCLARRLDQRGLDVEVTNFGQGGYVSKQGLLALMHELENGNVPNLVVFYDGVNDTLAAHHGQVAGVSQNAFHRRQDFNSRNSITPGKVVGSLFPGILRVGDGLVRRVAGPREVNRMYDEQGQPVDESLLADDVVRNYRSVMETVELLGRAHGFQTLFYWQPNAARKNPKTPFELTCTHGVDAFARIVYQRVAADPVLQKHPNFHNLADVFADEPEPLFVDCCHLGERGNDLIAQRMLGDVVTRLRNIQRPYALGAGLPTPPTTP